MNYFEPRMGIRGRRGREGRKADSEAATLSLWLYSSSRSVSRSAARGDLFQYLTRATTESENAAAALLMHEMAGQRKGYYPYVDSQRC